MQIAHFEGWECAGDLEGSRARLRRVLNSADRPGHAPRNFDIDWARIALDFFPVDELTPLFQRAAALAEVRRELADEQRPGMRKVEPRRAAADEVA